VSPILHRYHLVHLVKRWDELYDEIVGSAAHPQSLAPRRGLRKQTVADKMAGTKRAAKLALERLTSEAYPEHRQEIMNNVTQHEKDFKLLQNRLSNGQNWNALQKKFGVGILALVPTGSDAGFSNTSKFPSHLISTALTIMASREPSIMPSHKSWTSYTNNVAMSCTR
jgi:hypothetical protein